MGDREGAVITLEEIYREVKGSKDSLTRMEERMKNMEDKFNEVDQVHQKADKAEDNAEEALRRLDQHILSYKKRLDRDDENRRFWIKMAITVAGILIPIVITVAIFLMPILVQYHT